MPPLVSPVPVPDWVLARVHSSKQEDWVLFREGWLTFSEELRTCPTNIREGIRSVYVSQHGEQIIFRTLPPDVIAILPEAVKESLVNERTLETR